MEALMMTIQQASKLPAMQCCKLKLMCCSRGGFQKGALMACAGHCQRMAGNTKVQPRALQSTRACQQKSPGRAPQSSCVEQCS